MKEDYLWDGSGEPDPEVQRLEKVLGRYRHNRVAPLFEQVVEVHPVKTRSALLQFSFLVSTRGVGASNYCLPAAVFVFLSP